MLLVSSLFLIEFPLILHFFLGAGCLNAGKSTFALVALVLNWDEVLIKLAAIA
jgi:hypothetical protein